jgi:hypothetical protein
MQQQNSGNRNKRKLDSGEIMNADDVKPGQANMMEEEAQNINKDRADRLDSDAETKRARNKANQGSKEGRDERSRNSGSR